MAAWRRGDCTADRLARGPHQVRRLCKPLEYGRHCWLGSKGERWSSRACERNTAVDRSAGLQVRASLTPSLLLSILKLKFWDCRQQQPVGQFDLPERAYAMDVQDSLLVVGTAGRHVIAYDLSGAPREHTRKESPLKFQTRCIACFPEATGFAIGSIEGRVGIHYLQKVQGKESFAFKCHRQDTNVHAVNVIAFHVSVL